MKRYITTIQIIIEVEDDQAPQDALSETLSNNDNVFDWAYLNTEDVERFPDQHDAFAYPEEVTLPEDYHEGEAFLQDFRI